ncbi:MAG: ATP-binding protein [Actinomycetota bacterium]
MDATVAIPLHFTLETLGLAAAGLVLSWSFRRDTWPVALGALSFGAGQALHAGAFLSTEDDVALIVLRACGIALMSFGLLSAPDRELFAGGLAGLSAATIWGGIAGHSVDDLVIGPHVLVGLGSIALAAWAWRATRPSVRQRVLNSFILVLAIAIVVAGGAVARVAALDKRNAELDGLAPAAAGVRLELVQLATDLTRRAAVSSPTTAAALIRGQATIDLSGLDVDPGQSVALFTRAGAPVGSVSNGPELGATLASSDAVRSALGGTSTSGFALDDAALTIIGAAPVFRPGSAGASAADVIGAIVFVELRTPGNVESSADAYDADIEVAVVGEDAQMSSDRALADLASGSFDDSSGLESIDTTEGEWPSARTRLSPAGPILVLAVPGSEVVEATTGLMRALLIAILVSALLAVTVALWLSSRIARPMLDLVEEGERLKTDFLSSVSHELRTPLTPIRGYTEMLRRGRVPARRATGILDEIGEAAQRLERIVTLLVDVAAMEAGRFRIEVSEWPVAEVLEPAAERWTDRSRKHRVEVNIPRSVPRVRADPDAVGRALDELIDNAIKFSPDGGVVELRTRRTRSGIEISVADSGPGIDPDRREALTEAFAQASSGDARSYGGLGLGLAFVDGVLGLHRSRLVVDTAPDGGTVCSFTLPLAGSVARVPAKAARKKKR